MFLTNVTLPIGDYLERYISTSDHSVFIFSPFITNTTLVKLLKDKKNVTIVTSWKEEHLLKGVSSLDLYPLCREKGWKLYINSRLHAKIYSNGLNNGYIGSANCTERALFSKEGNIECITYIESFSMDTKIELNEIIYDSYLVNDEIYDEYVKWYSQQSIPTWEFGEIHLDTPKSDRFSIYELPALYDPMHMRSYLKAPNKFKEYASLAEHDIALYGTLQTRGTENEFLNHVADIFFEHPFIKEIDKHITSEGIYFGEFKKLIQDICTDVPVPYRYELTELVQNLMNWFTILAPFEYNIRCKNVSQCLYRLD